MQIVGFIVKNNSSSHYIFRIKLMVYERAYTKCFGDEFIVFNYVCIIIEIQ
jgi:hypothetical protein